MKQFCLLNCQIVKRLETLLLEQKTKDWTSVTTASLQHFSIQIQPHFVIKATVLCLEFRHYSLHFNSTLLTGVYTKAVNASTGEASASTMWDNQAWSYLDRDREDLEPPFLAQDFIHTVQPGAKIIIMLRDPVERYCRGIHPHSCLCTDVTFNSFRIALDFSKSFTWKFTLSFTLL